MSELDEIKKYLKPYSPKEMEAFPVSPRVNSPANDDKAIINPA
jgi:putative SOS response-associated peptidase YedK